MLVSDIALGGPERAAMLSRATCEVGSCRDSRPPKLTITEEEEDAAADDGEQNVLEAQLTSLLIDRALNVCWFTATSPRLRLPGGRRILHAHGQKVTRRGLIRGRSPAEKTLFFRKGTVPPGTIGPSFSSTVVRALHVFHFYPLVKAGSARALVWHERQRVARTRARPRPRPRPQPGS